MYFVLFWYCGDCSSQVELSLSYVIVVQKSSSGDEISLLFWREKVLPLTFFMCSYGAICKGPFINYITQFLTLPEFFFIHYFRLFFAYPPLVAGRQPDKKKPLTPKTLRNSKSFVASDLKNPLEDYLNSESTSQLKVRRSSDPPRVILCCCCCCCCCGRHL